MSSDSARAEHSLTMVGVPLTAMAGTWTAGTSFTYKWSANGTVLSGSTSKTYTPTAATVGKRLTVQVTGSLTGYASTSKTSLPTGAVAKGALTTATPTLTGTAKVASVLTAVTGQWSAGTVFSYEWLANGTVIGGATKATYAPSAGQVGQKVSVRVTGTLAGYVSQSKMSIATFAVVKGILTSATPTIAGTPKVATVLTAKSGTWTAGTVFAFQWFAGGKAISGATRATFTPTSAQSGLKLTVQITGTLTGYVPVSKKSTETATVGR